MQERAESEDGAIAIMAAVLAVALVLSAALAVDVGRVAYASRDQQGATDRAALDSVQILPDAYVPLAEAYERALVSLERNPEVGGVEERVLYRVDLGYAVGSGATDFEEVCGGYFDATQSSTDRDGLVSDGILEAEIDDTTAARQSAPTSCADVDLEDKDPDALRLWTYERVDYVLAIGGSHSTLHKISIAGLEEVARISVRSGLASFEADAEGELDELLDGLLSELVGGDVSVDAVTWRSLVDVDIALEDLIEADTTVASREQFVSIEVTVGEILDASITALSNEEGSYEAEIELLEHLRTELDGSVVAGFELGDLFGVTTENPDAILDSRVNIQDLVMGSLLVANAPEDAESSDGNVVAFELESGEDLLGLEGLFDVTAKVVLIEAPQYDVGPARRDAGGNWVTSAKTAHFDLLLELRVDEDEAETLLGSLITDLLGSLTCTATGLLGADCVVDVDLHVKGARATADLTDIACADPTSDSVLTTEVETDALWVAAVEAGDEPEEDDWEQYSEGGTETLIIDGIPGRASTSDSELLDIEILDGVVDPLTELLGVEAGSAEVRGHWVGCEYRRLLPLDH